jgi:anti-anti-sigma factor
MPTVRTFNPEGRLDGDRANQLRQEIMDAVQEKPDIVLLDLTEVNFMNSSAIGALVAMKKAVEKADIKFCLCSVSDQVKVIFELTRMDQVLKPFDDRATFETEVFPLFSD